MKGRVPPSTQWCFFTLLLWFSLWVPSVQAEDTDNNPESSPNAGSDSDEPTSPDTLDKIIITPEQTREPEAEQPNGTAISGKTLATTPGSAGDPIVTLQTLPGLAFTSDDDFEPAVRGSRPDDNYFQVDSLPVDYLFHAGGLISVFNADLVESFSIYPSAYGPEFGGVTGGAFDVKLRDPETDRFHTKLDISILQSGVLVEGPVTENQSFYLAGRLSYLDLIVADQIEGDEEDIELVQFPKYHDYQAKYVWRLNDDVTLRLQANGAADDIELIIGTEAGEVVTDPILAGRFLESTDFNQQGLTAEVDFGSGLFLKSAIAHTGGATRFRIGGAGSVDLTYDTWLLKSHVDFTAGDDHDVTVGGIAVQSKFALDLEFRSALCTEFETDCNFTNAESLATELDQTVSSTQLFVRDSWYVSDKLTLFSGLTLLHEDWLGETQIEPRFALEYALADDLTISAGAGIYHQMPSFEQFDDTFGNPDIDYIKSVHSVLGVKKEFSNGWSIKSELYHKSLDKLVTGDELLNYANNGQGSTIGLDTLIRKDLTDRLSGWFSLTVAESTRTNRATGEKFDFEYDQPVNATLVATYKLSDKWRIGAKYWVHSGALYTPVIGATEDPDTAGLYIPQYGPINSQRFPMYQRLDLRFDRTVEKSNGRKYSFYFDILNLLDNENVSSYEYNADYTERTTSKQIPLIAAIGFKAEF